MANLMDHATNPLAENKTSMAEMKRFLFNPTKAEIAEHQRKAKESAAKIRAGIAKLEAKGFW